MAGIQAVYNVHQQLGLPGEVGRAGEPWAFDQAPVNAETLPGAGVFLNGDQEWELPADLAGSKVVTHVVGFDPTDNNAPIVTATNQATAIAYPADTIAKAMAHGTIVVLAGEAIVQGDEVIYDPTDGLWNVYSPTPATIADFRAAVFVAETPGGTGEPIIIRHHGRSQR